MYLLNISGYTKEICIALTFRNTDVLSAPYPFFLKAREREGGETPHKLNLSNHIYKLLVQKAQTRKSKHQKGSPRSPSPPPTLHQHCSTKRFFANKQRGSKTKSKNPQTKNTHITKNFHFLSKNRTSTNLKEKLSNRSKCTEITSHLSTATLSPGFCKPHIIYESTKNS